MEDKHARGKHQLVEESDELDRLEGTNGPQGTEWDVLDIYFRDHMYAFTKHHHDSFRQFLKRYIPESIKSFNPVTMIKLDEAGDEKVKVDVYIGGESGTKIYLDRPAILDSDGKPMLLSPLDARLHNLTYSTKIYADIDIVYTKEGILHAKKEFPHTLIGSIPLMLHSDQCMLHGQGSKVLRAFGECPLDPGGYFIVDGKEKVIISQERITTNRLFVSQLDEGDNQDFSIRGYIRCTGETGDTKLSPRTVEFKVVRTACFLNRTEHSQADKESLEGDRCYNTQVTQKYQDQQGAILVSLPSINGMVPLCTVFRALGVESDKEIVEIICGSIEDAPGEFLNFLRPSIVHGASTGIFTMDKALEHLSYRTFYKSIQQVKSIIAQDIFPNINSSSSTSTSSNTESRSNIKHKAMYLGYLVSLIMKTALNVMQPSDRDSYAFKRVDISGILLAQLFHETYSTFRKQIRNVLDQEYNYGPVKNDGNIERLVDNFNLHRVFQAGIITDVFTKSLKGMWGPPTDDPEQGLVQDLSRISYIGFLSHLRRVNMPLDRTIKITSPHRLHSQQWGIMCPFESPDGASIGYLKNFALMTHICSGSDYITVVQVLLELEQEPYLQIYAISVHSVQGISHVLAASKNSVKILINGTWYGITMCPHMVVKTLRLYRRNGLINTFISVAWNIKEGEIRIQTEPGRPCRPLFIVENSKVLLFDNTKMHDALGSGAYGKRTETFTWFDMLYGSLLPQKDKTIDTYQQDTFTSPYTIPEFVGKTHEYILGKLAKTQGVIEFLDIEEENTMMVSMSCRNDVSTGDKLLSLTPFHTHAEIHPSTAFSVVTNNVPFANHNQGPRVIFHAAQSKQALGIYATNFAKRFDTNSYIQHYPQKRIVTTRGAHYNGCDRMPNGANVIVAIATYSGYNQEDSIIINKNSIDRGLFQITGYKTMVATEKAISVNERLMFANPITMRDAGQPIEGIKHANYSLLNSDGIVKEDSYIPRGQEAVVLGMVHAQESVKEVQRGVLMYKEINTRYTDVSLKTDVHHYGKVDKVFLGTSTPGAAAGAVAATHASRICKIKFRKVRRPELGNKYCSSHGQKGVIGMIIPQENMPFTKDGIVPDLIINPHAFPSRMTMGHLVETVMAKVCCLEGMTGDGTVFIPFDKDELYDRLEKQKFERYGNEIMYNGRTGEQIQSEIFLGPIYYYCLKHMVADKVHSRSTGAKTQLTRQPTSGRSAGGGLRIGEMERDALIGHGLSQFIKECMMEKSDKYKWAVCRFCGTIANFAPAKGIAECGSCNRQDISVVETPYSFKLLVQELEAMGIQMRVAPEIIQDAMLDQSDSEASGSDDDIGHDDQSKSSEINEVSDDSGTDENEDESTGGHDEKIAGTEEEWFDSGLGGGGNISTISSPISSSNDNDFASDDNFGVEGGIGEADAENFDGDSDDGYEAVGGFESLDSFGDVGNNTSVKIYSGDENRNLAADMSYMLNQDNTDQHIQNVNNSIINPGASMISNPDIKVIDISSINKMPPTGSPKHVNIDENFDEYSKEDEFFEE